MGRNGKYQQDAALAAQRLRRWRHLHAMTQEEMAALCGVSRMTVIRWEDPGCDYSPGITHLIRIGRKLQTSLAYELARPPEEDE